MEHVGVVVIGRNEGARLQVCLESVARYCPRVVYVDSASTDASVELAHAQGIKVLELNANLPLAAGRARREGLKRLLELEPSVRLVQFVDGDCELSPGWIERAARSIEANERVAVVCGRRRERFPEASIYNQLADMEWDTPVGLARACGGDALMRVDAVEMVNSFNPTVIAGEEPELCHRLRAAGWKVLRIDAEMTRHDLAMHRFEQWWRRQVRGGYGAGDMARRFAGTNEGEAEQYLRSYRRWVICWPLSIGLAGTFGGIAWGPAAAVFCALAGCAAFPAQALRLAMKQRRRGYRWKASLACGLLTLLSKWPGWIGVQQYRRDWRSGQGSRLIEYKRQPAHEHVAPKQLPTLPVATRSVVGTA
jgi:cellulose synthase/poly-beta-1,6-N-acetylglucosamine synthase-like glycosyltransferase